MKRGRLAGRESAGRISLAPYLVVSGIALILTGVFPAHVNPEGTVYLWELFGVAAFAHLAQLLCLPLMGMLFLGLCLSALDEGLRGALVVLVLIGVPLIVQLNPFEDLALLGMWEDALGHQLLLLGGVVASSVAARLRLCARIGTPWAVFGSAMFLAYLMTPNPGGWIPVVEAVRSTINEWDRSLLYFMMAVTRVGAYLIPGGLFFLVLVVVRGGVRSSEEHRRLSLLVGWLGMGFLPGLAVSLLVREGLALGGGAGVFWLLRSLILLAALTIVLPNGIAVARLEWRKTGGRPSVGSLE